MNTREQVISHIEAYLDTPEAETLTDRLIAVGLIQADKNPVVIDEVKILRNGLQKIVDLDPDGYTVFPQAARETLAKADAATEDRCTWTEDEWDGSWNGSCGVKWVFEDGGPVENSMKFCPECGKHVRLSKPRK